MKYPNFETELVRQGWSGRSLAKSLGVEVKTFYGWINGKHAIPLFYLKMICEILGCSADYLLTRESDYNGLWRVLGRVRHINSNAFVIA